MQDTFARATHSAYAAARPSARATIGYLVYNPPIKNTLIFADFNVVGHEEEFVIKIVVSCVINYDQI